METTPSDIAELATTSRLSVVGIAKNCGKTTTLNYLLAHRRRRGLAGPALLSIGVDGEAEDALLGTSKPSIYLEQNQWVITAEQAIGRSTARFEYVRSLGLTTPLGEVFACRVVEEGTVVLAGLRQRREVVDAVDMLQSLGDGPVWIDGAYGRRIGAHPDVATDVVVATGAVAGDCVDDVVARTDALLERLSLPGVDDRPQASALQRCIEADRPFFVSGDGDSTALSVSSAVTGLKDLGDQWSDDVAAIAIPGLISNRVAEELLEIGGRRTLLIPDWTVIHADDSLWRRLEERWTVRVLQPVRAVAMSYNPTSPKGQNVDAQGLKYALQSRYSTLPIFDPLR